MTWQLTWHAVFLIIAAAGATIVGAMVWQRHTVSGAKPLAYLMFAAAWTTLSYAFEAAAVDPTSKIFWAKLTYLGSVSGPLFFLEFALDYTHQRWLTAQRRLALWVMPILTVILVASNEFHHIIWTGFSPGPIAARNVLIYHHGPWYWLAVVYFYCIIGVATGYLIWSIRHVHKVHHRQILTVLLAIPWPWFSHLIYVLNIGPFPGQDLSPVAFIFSGMLLAWGLYRFHLFDLVPVARDAIIENMGDGVLVLDNLQRVVDINSAARRLLRLEDSPIGQPAPDAFARWPELLRCCHEHHDQQEIPDILLPHGDGHFVDLRISALRDHRGNLTGRLVVFRDVTALQELRAKVQAANEELNVRLAELEARNQELDAFARTVAHDLKTPLAQTMGYADFLANCGETLAPETVQSSLEAIVHASKKMNYIIEEILLLSQVRKAEVETVPLDMAHLVDESLGRLRHLQQQMNGDIVVHDIAAWPPALGYPAWVEEVWVNYISNALKYGGRPPCVEIGATPCDDGMVRFWVRDNGIGLTYQEQMRLFQPFERIGQVRATGWGLGLSIVLRIVDKLGGEVGVESSPEGGCTFSFTLPQARN